MQPQNLYSLLSERLLLNAEHITIAVYNVLFEVSGLMSEHPQSMVPGCQKLFGH